MGQLVRCPTCDHFFPDNEIAGTSETRCAVCREQPAPQTEEKPEWDIATTPA
jgi:methionyl-tRNA synthetase